MAYIMLAALVFITVSMALMLARLIGGPSLYDRLLAVNSFGTKTVLFLCVFCFVVDRPDGIDIALLYALMNFIATIAVLKFFNYRALSVGLIDVEPPEAQTYAELKAALKKRQEEAS